MRIDEGWGGVGTSAQPVVMVANDSTERFAPETRSDVGENTAPSVNFQGFLPTNTGYGKLGRSTKVDSGSSATSCSN